MAKTRLEHTRDERIEKLNKLKELGINPFPAQSKKDEDNRRVVDNFADFEGKTVTLAGRMMSLREHGKLAFADLMDQSGTIQLFIRIDDLEPTNIETQTLGFENLKLLDAGDFVQATGEVVKTKTGQISLLVKNLKLLTKTIRPLPSSHDIIADPETIFRKRYLDLITNRDHMALFQRKARFWQVQRQFMADKGFIEVEMPVLEHVTGGADARPFVTHMNALDQEFYLRISTELYQKRLIGGGMEKVYTLAPNFRNEGLSDEHLPEYTQIEWYWAYADYESNMQLVEEIIKHTVKHVYGKTAFETRGHKFDLSNTWERISYPDIIKERLGIDIFSSSEDEMKTKLAEHKVKLDGAINRARLIDNLWKIIRKELSGPAFLINEPKFMSPLAKSKHTDPETTERFHVIIAGSELGNGYSELNDPIDQLERFNAQQEARDAGDDEAQMLDVDYVEMLEYGMPPTSGYAHSERLFWFLENVTAREGTLFPALRNKIDPVNQRIYGIKPAVKQKVSASPKQPSVQGISMEVKDQFPGIFFAQVVINDVDISKSNEDLENHKQQLVESRKNITVEEIGNIKPISKYRELFKATGTDWHSKRPSPEALLRRIVQGKNLYNINTAVDAYNLAVVETGVGLGGFDADKLALPVALRFSQEGEQMMLLGDDKPTSTRDGQLVYADQDKPITIDLNYRDIDETKITTKTKNIVLFADGAPGLSEDEVAAALKKGAEYIAKYSGGNIGEIEIIK